MSIDLQEFLDWYKKSEIIYQDKKRIFREPKLKDLKLKVFEMLEKYCIEWDFKEFLRIINEELSSSQQTAIIQKVLSELGLV